MPISASYTIADYAAVNHTYNRSAAGSNGVELVDDTQRALDGTIRTMLIRNELGRTKVGSDGVKAAIARVNVKWSHLKTTDKLPTTMNLSWEIPVANLANVTTIRNIWKDARLALTALMGTDAQIDELAAARATV